MATTKDIALILSFTDKGTPVVKKAVAATKAELAKLAKEAERTGKGFKTMKQQAEKSAQGMSGFKKVMKSTAIQMATGMGVMMGVQGAMRAVRKVISDTIQTGREFERAWANVTTMLSISEGETKKLRAELIALSPTLGDTTELAAGMYQVLSASVDPAKAIMFLGEAAKSAKAGVTEVATAVDALTTVINAYGMQAEDVTEVSDIMFQTVKRGKLTYEGMSGALGTVVPIAAQVGVSFEEISAAMATMTRQGIDVNTTTMQLRQIMVAILKPTTDATAMAAKLGINFSAAGLKAKGLAAFLGEVQEKAGDDAEALVALFGNVRSLGGVMALGGKAAAGFAKDLSLMGNAAGSTEEAFEKQMDSMDFWIDVIKNSIGKMKIAFYEGFVGPFKEGIQTSKDLEVRVRELTLRAGELGEALGKIATIFGKLFGFIGDAIKKGGAVGGLAEGLTKVTMGIAKVETHAQAARKAQMEWMEQTEKNTKSMGDLEKSIHGSGVVSALEDFLIAGENIEALLEGGLGTILALANMKLLEKGIMDIGAILQTEMGKALHELDLEMVSFGMSLSSNAIDALKKLSEQSGVAADVLRTYLITEFEKLIEEAKKTKALEDSLEHLNKFKEGAKDLGITLDKDLRNKLEEITSYMAKFRGELSPRELEQLAKKAVVLADKLDKKLSPSMYKLAGALHDVREAATEVEVLTDGLVKGMTELQVSTDKAGVLIGGIFAPALYTAIGGLKKAYDAAKKYALVFKTDVRKELKETIETYKMFTDGTLEGAKLTEGSQLNLINTIVELHKKLGIDVPDEWKKMQKELESITKDTTKNLSKEFSLVFSGLSGIFRTLSDNYEGAMGDLLSVTGSAFDALGGYFRSLGKEGKVTFEGIMGAIGPMMGQIGGSIGEMISGAENSFKGLGASIGGIAAMIPGVGAALGPVMSAIGGLIGGLFKKKKKLTEAEKAAKALEAQVKSLTNVLSKYGDISEDTAKAIAESTKTMTGYAAVSKHFGDVIRDVGVDQKNINDLWKRSMEIAQHVKEGYLDATSGAKALGDSFMQLVEGAQKFGTEGSAAMVKFIKYIKQTGIEVQEVTDYINEQLGTVKSSGMSAAEGLLAMAKALPTSDAVIRLEEFQAGAKGLGITLDKDLRYQLEETTNYMTKFRDELSPQELEQLAKKAIGLADKLGEELSPEIYRLAGSLRDVGEAATEIEVLEDAFDEAVKSVLKFGTEGSATMADFIQKVKATGIEVQALTDYIDKQLGVVRQSGMNAAQGLAAMAKAGAKVEFEGVTKYLGQIEHFEKKQAGFNERLAEATNELEGLEEGSEAYATLSDEIKVLIDSHDIYSGKIGYAQAQINSLGITGAKSLETLESQTVAVFNAMIENGASYFEAMQSLGGTFDTLIEKHEAFGVEGNAAIQELLKIREVVTANEDLFNAIKGNLGVLNALANTGSLNQQILSDAATQAVNYHEQLTAAGLSGNQALSQIVPTLERLKFLSEEHELALDDTTQALIKQAEEQGLLGEKTISVTDAMLAGFGELIKALGGEVPAAFQVAMDSVAAVGDTTTTILDSTTQSAEGIANQLSILENQTLAVFNAMIENGASVAEAMDSIGPTLDILAEKYDEWGLQGSAAIDELLRLREVTQANKELFTAIEGNLGVLNALANTGSLTQQILTDSATTAGDYYNQIVEAGLSGNQALASMAPTLEKLRFLAKEHELALDDATLALIDQAEEAGLLEKQELSMQDTMMAGFGLMLKAMGVDMPAAFQKSIDKMHDMEDAMAGSGIVSALEEVNTKATTTFEDLNEGVGAVITSTGNLETAFKTTFTTAETEATSAALKMKTEMDTKSETVKGFLMTRFSDVFIDVKEKAKDAALKIQTEMEEKANAVKEALIDRFKEAFTAVETSAKGTGGRIKEVFEKVDINIPVKWYWRGEKPGEGEEEENGAGGGGGGHSAAEGFIGTVPVPTDIKVHPKELISIIPFDKLGDIASGKAGMTKAEMEAFVEALVEKIGGRGNLIYAPQISTMDRRGVAEFMFGPGKEALLKLIRDNRDGFTKELKKQTNKF